MLLTSVLQAEFGVQGSRPAPQHPLWYLILRGPDSLSSIQQWVKNLNQPCRMSYLWSRESRSLAAAIKASHAEHTACRMSSPDGESPALVVLLSAASLSAPPGVGRGSGALLGGYTADTEGHPGACTAMVRCGAMHCKLPPVFANMGNVAVLLLT